MGSLSFFQRDSLVAVLLCAEQSVEVSSEGPPLRASSHTLTQSVFYVTTKRRKKENHRTCHWRLSKAQKRGLWRWWRDPVLHVHVSREQQQQQQQPAGLFSITGVAA